MRLDVSNHPAQWPSEDGDRPPNSPDRHHPAIDLLESLINIDCTSDYELEIGLFLEQTLRGLGYTAERIPIAPGSDRHNVYAYLGGPGRREARVLLTAHMDTVPPHIPFSIEGDVVRGRGACDDMGPLVAQLYAVEELRAEGKVAEGDISFLFVVGEEKGGPGMLAANDMGLTWEAGIFAEPTEGKLGKGHKGNLVFELIAHGKACHSGYPYLGKSATQLLINALNDLTAAQWPESDLLGSSTLNIGKIEGGAGYNILAAEASALCSLRVAADLPGIKRQIADIVAQHLDVELRFRHEYPETLLEWEFEGLEAAPMSFGTDIPRLKGDHRKVLYGPGSILVAHGKDESIKISEIMDSIKVNKRLVMEFLK